jgi:hypothetical protein
MLFCYNKLSQLVVLYETNLYTYSSTNPKSKIKAVSKPAIPLEYSERKSISLSFPAPRDGPDSLAHGHAPSSKPALTYQAFLSLRHSDILLCGKISHGLPFI